MGSIWEYFKGRDLRAEAEVLREGVCRAYSAAAADPAGQHSFPVGRAFAESVGYETELLGALSGAAECFAGVSNVSVFADIPEGSAVLDVGCGGGLDSLVAARKTGPGGSVQAVDFSEAMIAKARLSACEAGLSVEFHLSDAENLPLEGGSIDIVLANGIFNLNPRRREIFREMHRVLRPGGAVYAAELVFQSPQKKKPVRNLEDWFS